MLLAILEGSPHSRAIATAIGGLNRANSPSRHAVWKRLRTNGAPAFFLAVFREVLDTQCKRLAPVIKNLDRVAGSFTRVIIEDGSILPLHPSLAETYPGSSNQHGTVASLRLRWATDLITGETIDASLHLGKENDMSTAKTTLGLLRSGDLVLRDMGYFCLNTLRQIADVGATYITRIPAGTTIRFLDDSDTGLQSRLQRTESDSVSWEVELGLASPLQGRLVAVRIPKARADRQKRKLRQAYKAEGRQPKRAELDMCNWATVFTNAQETDLDDAAVSELYRARWMIETYFKGLKSCQRLTTWSKHRTNAAAVECLALGHMIIGVLSLNLWRIMGTMVEGDSHSAEPELDQENRPIVGLLMAMECLRTYLHDDFRGLLRGGSRAAELRRLAASATQEKRKRRSLEQIITSL